MIKLDVLRPLSWPSVDSCFHRQDTPSGVQHCLTRLIRTSAARRHSSSRTCIKVKTELRRLSLLCYPMHRVTLPPAHATTQTLIHSTQAVYMYMCALARSHPRATVQQQASSQRRSSCLTRSRGGSRRGGRQPWRWGRSTRSARQDSPWAQSSQPATPPCHSRSRPIGWPGRGRG